MRADTLEATSRFLAEHPATDRRDDDKTNDPAAVSERLHERARITSEVVHPQVAREPRALEPDPLVRRDTASPDRISVSFDRGTREVFVG